MSDVQRHCSQKQSLHFSCACWVQFYKVGKSPSRNWRTLPVLKRLFWVTAAFLLIGVFNLQGWFCCCWLRRVSGCARTLTIRLPGSTFLFQRAYSFHCSVCWVYHILCSTFLQERLRLLQQVQEEEMQRRCVCHTARNPQVPATGRQHRQRDETCRTLNDNNFNLPHHHKETQTDKRS